MIKLSPSILSSNFLDLRDNIKKLEEAGVDYIHLDVMDGNYVPNITFGPSVIKNIKEATSLPLDVHLMVDRPERYVEDFAKAGADIITVHCEATTHLHRTLQSIRALGVRAGVSLNPASPIEFLNYVIDDVDLILIMSVNPGFGGQSFIPSSREKITKVRRLIDEKSKDIILEVDGGVKLDNAKELTELGADLLVVGSDIFDYDDIVSRIKEFKDIK